MDTTGPRENILLYMRIASAARAFLGYVRDRHSIPPSQEFNCEYMQALDKAIADLDAVH